MCGFCNVWVCVCVAFVMCGCFGNMCTFIYCVFVLFHLCTFILICFVCTRVKDYCQRVTTQLQLVIIIITIIIIVIIII